ncbi:hotdog fold thioesterase [Vibrio sp. SM6]|uniref:Hotdog fold thioesterase n=1 Tax=Vibrio agarilyticus TaxID=2726741 RepID=A0A7X8YHC1_9VIBR|nr:hotdog fold thioesterase [Vibrio agarilyticus]NLS13316.1 hotdog fold thioesterase [Vibrio agarilyticus]
MSIWKRPISLDILNSTSKNTLMEHLHIVYTDISDTSISASMPVCAMTHQPLGMLHGGASAALAETLGSLAANFAVEAPSYCVGLEINANHIRPMRKGEVIGTASPIHIGSRTQVWQIEITDTQKRLVCTSRITMAVMRPTTNELQEVQSNDY